MLRNGLSQSFTWVFMFMRWDESLPGTLKNKPASIRGVPCCNMTAISLNGGLAGSRPCPTELFVTVHGCAPFFLSLIPSNVHTNL